MKKTPNEFLDWLENHLLENCHRKSTTERGEGFNNGLLHVANLIRRFKAEQNKVNDEKA